MKLIGVVFVAVAVLVSAAPAHAQRLLGTLYAGNTGGPSVLVEINPATGDLVQTIGSVGYLVNGMTWDRTTDTLYATTSTKDANFPDGLITIDPVTGAGTEVGTGAGQYVNVPACSRSGVLYGWTEEGSEGDGLVLWDKAAGTISEVGPALETSEQGLAFDKAGVLYLVTSEDGDIYTINTATAHATSVGTLNQRAHHGSFHPSTNLYYGLDRTESTGGPGRQLVVANLATHNVEDLIPTVDLLHTLVFLPRPQYPVPAVGHAGLLVLLAFLAVVGFLALRSR